MTFPKFLRQGDTIGVTACSDGHTEEVSIRRIDSAKEQLCKKGFFVRETADVRSSEKGRSAPAKERAAQLMELVRDDDVRMVLQASGGDYLAEMLPYVDFTEIKRHPKWFQGYSDPTGLLFSIATKCDIATVYGANYGEFGMRPWHECLHRNLRILCGEPVVQHQFDYYQDGFIERVTGYETIQKDCPVCVRQMGVGNEEQGTGGFGVQERGTEPGAEAVSHSGHVTIQGRLLGGCLDVLLDLVGTSYEDVHGFVERYGKDGIFWYLESFALNSERLTIALWHLKEAGWFEHASGFIFGRPTFFESGTDTSYEEAVRNAFGSLGVPVLLDADIGHKPPYMTMINGAYAKLDYEEGNLALEMEFV